MRVYPNNGHFDDLLKALSLLVLTWPAVLADGNIEKDVLILTDKSVNSTVGLPGRSVLLVSFARYNLSAVL